MNYSDNENRLEVGPLRTAFFTGIVLCLYLSLPILQNSKKTPFAPIDNRLNLNTASVYELGELPGIGPAKAQAIVEYRQGKEKAFETAADLENVKGIGEKTVEKLKQWFVFE